MGMALKEAWKIWFCLMSVCVLGIAGCSANFWGSRPTETPQVARTSAFIYPSDQELQSSVVLPNFVGAQWSYEIKIGKVDPIKYSEIVFPMSNGKAMLFTEKNYFSGLKNQKGKRDGYLLTMKVIGRPARQGPFQYVHAVEVEIIRDDLGVYEGAKQVFWLIPPGPFEGMAIATAQTDLSEVVTYPPLAIPGEKGVEDGFSIRYLLLHCFPGTCDQQYTLGGSSDEKFQSLWPTKKFPGYEDQWVFHYQRSIQRSNDEAKVTLKDGFVEDTWYAPGVGLILLEQRINDIVSMTWNLISYYVPPQ